MNFFEKVERWGDKHHTKWLDGLRILLGLVILLKGIYFINHHEELENMIRASKVPDVYSDLIVHYVAMIQLVVGPLIMVGLITRIAIIFQLPIIIGAITFAGLRNGLLMSIDSDLPFAIIMLFLLVFFLVEGSGPISMDGYIKSHHPDDL